MTLEERARQFIFHKKKWMNIPKGQPHRRSFKRAYQIFESDLYGDLPDVYRIDGLVLVKGIIKNDWLGDFPYIAIYTEASYKNRLAFLQR